MTRHCSNSQSHAGDAVLSPELLIRLETGTARLLLEQNGLVTG